MELSREERLKRAKVIYERMLDDILALGVIVNINEMPYCVAKGLSVNFITRLSFQKEDLKPDLNHPACQPDWDEKSC